MLCDASFDCALIAFSKKAPNKLSKQSRPRAASLQCFTSQGAGTQHPIHFRCAPAHSHTITANSKASAARQTEQQQTTKQALQSKQHSNRNPRLPPPKHLKPRAGTTDGEGRKHPSRFLALWSPASRTNGRIMERMELFLALRGP